MGRVQGGARAAFATPSWGPARMMYFSRIIDTKEQTSGDKPKISILKITQPKYIAGASKRYELQKSNRSRYFCVSIARFR